MLKKILIPAVVIVSGLMIGIILSTSQSKKESTITPATTLPTAQKVSVAPQNLLKSFTTIHPPTIKVTPDSLDGGRDLDKIDKATITVNYENPFPSDLKDIKIQFSTDEVKNISIAASDNAKFSPGETVSGSKYAFTVPDLKSGEKSKAKFLVFSGDAGIHILNGEIITNQGNVTIEPLTITVK